MNKKYLIISDNSTIIQSEIINGELFWNHGYLCIKSTSIKHLINFEKTFEKLKIETKLDKIEHCLKIVYQVNLNDYMIYLSDKMLY